MRLKCIHCEEMVFPFQQHLKQLKAIIIGQDNNYYVSETLTLKVPMEAEKCTFLTISAPYNLVFADSRRRAAIRQQLHWQPSTIDDNRRWLETAGDRHWIPSFWKWKWFIKVHFSVSIGTCYWEYAYFCTNVCLSMGYSYLRICKVVDVHDEWHEGLTGWKADKLVTWHQITNLMGYK